MRKSSVPGKRKFEGFSWISVDEESPSKYFNSTVKPSRDSSLPNTPMYIDSEPSEDPKHILTAVNFKMHTQDQNKTDKANLLLPRASNFVSYDSNKYHCPYYIKPQLWEKMNTAPRFNEKLEIEKVHHFYNYMHIGNVNPNPLHSSRVNQPNKPELIRDKLAKLPTIQKYKT